MSNLWQTLTSRGLVQDSSDPAEIAKLLASPGAAFYCGIDPTADSLHVGHLAALMMMRRLQIAGHKPIALLGSATGMIGDPSGKSDERKLLSDEEIEKNLKGLEQQVKKLLRADGATGYKLVRNDSWLKEISFVDFLRDVGKHFSVNMMLGKESVKSRLENREQGISYTEFSYMLLQAYDFYHLAETAGCRLQIGGSDQWGNITAGIELIRRKSQPGVPAAHGFTFPLVTTKAGTKFGKTEAGAVWLDAKRTSPYRFYQFWLNTADADASRYLRIFCDLPDEELQALDKRMTAEPDVRPVQRQLAETLTTLIHSEAETRKAVEASRVLFGESLANVDRETLLDIFSDVPSTTIPRGEINKGLPIQDLLVRVQLAKSKGDAKRAIEGGGVYLNNERVSDLALVVAERNLLDGAIFVLRSGKRNYHLVQLGN
jgi:tyrosyl-tRNA synthetase